MFTGSQIIKLADYRLITERSPIYFWHVICFYMITQAISIISLNLQGSQDLKSLAFLL